MKSVIRSIIIEGLCFFLISSNAPLKGPRGFQYDLYVCVKEAGEGEKKRENAIYSEGKQITGYLGTGVEGGGVGWIRKGPEASLGGEMDLFVILIVVVYTYIKTYQLTHFKCMPFIFCQLYLSEAI